MKIYALFDVVAEEFMPVFQSNTDESAIRSVNRLFDAHPEMPKKEYKLFKLCNFYYNSSDKVFKSFGSADELTFDSSPKVLDPFEDNVTHVDISTDPNPEFTVDV